MSSMLYFQHGCRVMVSWCRLFRQPLVPMIAAEDGHWLMAGPLQPMLKPGGHGAIWKLMHDQGVFDWLAQHTCEAAIVRQIRCVSLLAISGLVWQTLSAIYAALLPMAGPACLQAAIMQISSEH